MKKVESLLLTGLISCCLVFTAGAAQASETIDNNDLNNRVTLLEQKLMEREKEDAENPFAGLMFSGQMTMIYQSSGLNLKNGDLDTTNSSSQNYQDYAHKSGTGTFSTDLFIEKEFDNGGYFMFNVEFANGSGVDAPLQGGGMVNNDVMEDPDNHSQPYIAHAYYEHTLPLGQDGYNLVLDLGKFGVPDFFDEGDRVADQTAQFLNQAICNNGAFDYVQDLQGHGYTYGARAALETPFVTLSGAFMSSDSYLDNIHDKHAIIGSLAFNVDYTEEIKGGYRIYMFKNYGEYARFDTDGNLVTKDASAIGTEGNKDDLNKGGFGISIDQSLPMGINVFAKYGIQDDDRDVRHYEDMDECIMFGFDVSGENWGRPNDVIGVAYEIGKLTGNHRKAHEKGYSGVFDRPGVGTGNYADEEILEIYYNLALTENTTFSIDYQRVDNFYYSSKIGAVDFWGARFNVVF